MLTAGSLRYPILVQAQTNTTDAYGQSSEVWTTVVQTNADVRVASSRDIYALGVGFTSQVTHKIVMRFPPTPIVAGMRILFRERTFLIQTASDPDEQRIQLDLMCLEQQK